MFLYLVRCPSGKNIGRKSLRCSVSSEKYEIVKLKSPISSALKPEVIRIGVIDMPLLYFAINSITASTIKKNTQPLTPRKEKAAGMARDIATRLDADPQ